VIFHLVTYKIFGIDRAMFSDSTNGHIGTSFGPNVGFNPLPYLIPALHYAFSRSTATRQYNT